MSSTSSIQQDCPVELIQLRRSSASREDQLLLASMSSLKKGLSEVADAMEITEGYLAPKETKPQDDTLQFINLTEDREKLKEALKTFYSSAQGFFSSSESSQSSDKKGPSIEEIFKMQGALMMVLNYITKSLGVQAQQQVQMGEEILKVLENDYNEIEKHASHHSFWQFLKDIVKVVFDILSDALFGLGFAIQSPKTQGKDFKNFGEDLKDIVMFVVDAVGALGCLLAAGLSADPKNSALSEKCLKEAGKLGEALLENPVLSWVGDIIAIALAAVAVVTQQYELLVVVGLLFVLSATGAFKDMTNGIANSLEKKGMKDARAKIIADIIVIAAVTFLTLGVGTVASIEMGTEEVADSAATIGEDFSAELEDGIEMDVFSSNVADSEMMEESANVEKSAEAQVKRIRHFFKNFNLKRFIGLTAMGAGSAISSSSLAMDILQALGKEDNSKWIILFELMQAVIGCAIAFVGGVNAFSSFGGEDESLLSMGVKKFVGMFRQIPQMEELSAALQNDRVLLMLRKMQKKLMVAEGLVDISQGGALINAGYIQAKIAELEGEIAILTNEQNMQESQLQDTVKHLGSVNKAFDAMINGFGEEVAGANNAVARAIIG